MVCVCVCCVPVFVSGNCLPVIPRHNETKCCIQVSMTSARTEESACIIGSAVLHFHTTLTHIHTHASVPSPDDKAVNCACPDERPDVRCVPHQDVRKTVAEDLILEILTPHGILGDHC